MPNSAPITPMVARMPLVKTVTALSALLGRRCRYRPLDCLEPVDDVPDLLIGQRTAVELAPGGHVVAVAEDGVGPAPLDRSHDVVPGGLVTHLGVQHVLVEHHGEVGGVPRDLLVGLRVDVLDVTAMGVIAVTAGTPDATGVRRAGGGVRRQRKVLLTPLDGVLGELLGGRG